MDQLAVLYVKLVLEIDTHEESYVDAYYGPSEWRDQAQKSPRDLPRLLSGLEELMKTFKELQAAAKEQDEIERLRFIFMEKQLIASTTFVSELIAKGKPGTAPRLPFDEESRLLYDAVAPVHTEGDFKEILEKIKELLPGSGSLIERYTKFKEAFVIPKDKLEVVFKEAIAEARRRTLKWCQLPQNEEFVLEFVNGKPWSGYNWFKGNAFSVIQINTDLPIYIDRAIDLAAHEGYPGHHVNNALLEKCLVRDRTWVEFSVYPLYSPQSFIAEGTANYGIDVCFPDRTEYESTVLFPLAGIDPATAAKYYEVEKLVGKLSYAGNEAARRYLNGQCGKAEAVEWLTTYALMPLERAEKRVSFFEQYRSYVINYNLGQDRVGEFMKRECANKQGGEQAEQVKWEVFCRLLSTPQVASNLL